MQNIFLIITIPLVTFFGQISTIFVIIEHFLLLAFSILENKNGCWFYTKMNTLIFNVNKEVTIIITSIKWSNLIELIKIILQE